MCANIGTVVCNYTQVQYNLLLLTLTPSKTTTGCGAKHHPINLAKPDPEISSILPILIRSPDGVRP